MKKLIIFAFLTICLFAANLWAATWETNIKNMVITETVDADGNILIHARSVGIKSKNYSQDSNNDSGAHAEDGYWLGRDTTTKKPKTALELVFEKAKKTNALNDVFAAKEEAKKERWWKEDCSDCLMPAESKMIRLLGNLKIAGAYPVFVDWLNFLKNRPSVISSSMEIDSFVSYVEEVTPEKKAVATKFLEHLLNTTWASEKAKEKTTGDIVASIYKLSKKIPKN